MIFLIIFYFASGFSITPAKRGTPVSVSTMAYTKGLSKVSTMGSSAGSAQPSAVAISVTAAA